jgi:hypothetical protein
VGGEGDVGELGVADLDAFGVPVRVVGGLHGEPVVVEVPAMSSTMVRMSTRG